MSKLKFWHRKKQISDPDLPQEVRDYYASTTHTKRSSAWLLGILTMIVTLALAVVLYFAGQFVYNQFTETKTDTGDTSESQDNNETTGQDSNSESEEVVTLPGNENNTEDVTPEPDPSQTGTLSTSTDKKIKPGKTPDTGPGDVVAIFVGTTIVASLAYETLARKKQAE